MTSSSEIQKLVVLDSAAKKEKINGKAQLG